MLLTLAACGGGGGGSSTPALVPGASPSTPAPAPVQRTATIEFYGDSTGRGLGTNGQLWLANVQVPGWQAVNLSQHSLAAADALPGSARFDIAPWSQRMQASPAQVVVIALALNDTLASDVATYRNTLLTLVQIAQGEGKRVILQTPNPTNIDTGPAFAQAMRDVAIKRQGVAVIDLEADLGTWVPALTADGVHPTPAVYDRMATFVQGALVRVLADLTPPP